MARMAHRGKDPPRPGKTDATYRWDLPDVRASFTFDLDQKADDTLLMAKSRIPPDIFFLDRQSKQSLQGQIRETVIASILSHQAPPGAILPSSRRLATHLGVARMTVTLAYQELVAQGYVETESRAGYRVLTA